MLLASDAGVGIVIAHLRRNVCPADASSVPAAVSNIMLDKVASTAPSNASEVSVDIGWSACQLQPSANDGNSNGALQAIEPAAPAGGPAQGSRLRVRRSLLLPQTSSPHWCLFCAGHAVTTEVCNLQPQAVLATVEDTDWQPCVGSCAWYISTQARFCVKRVTASAPIDVQVQAIAPGLPTAYHAPPGAFPVLGPVPDCAQGGNWLQDLQVRACIPEAALSANCDGPSWEWVLEGDCSAPCGGGTRDWRLACQDQRGEWISKAQCEGNAPLEPSPVVCNTAPCVSALWAPSEWAECDRYGWRTRTLTCMARSRKGAAAAVSSGACAQLQRPPTMERCGASTATFQCQTGACYHGNCTATHDACECEAGWRGEHCDFHDECDGVVGADGRCCSGLRGAEGECCGPQHELDFNGACCAASDLDACRICRGSSTAMDLAGSCGTGRLEAGGLRCDGVLDGAELCTLQKLLRQATCDVHAGEEIISCTLPAPCKLTGRSGQCTATLHTVHAECGVCNGSGMSCALQATVQVVLVSAQPMNSTRVRDLNTHGLPQEAAVALLSSVIPAPPESFTAKVTQLPIQKAAVNGTLVFTQTVTADMTVMPAAVAEASQPHAQTYWLYQLLNSATLTSSALLDDTGSIKYTGRAVSARGIEVLLAAVQAVGRRAVCGNGLCKLGELAPLGDNITFGTPCAHDCALTVKACSQNSDGIFCSGAHERLNAHVPVGYAQQVHVCMLLRS
jgi:hypothetical protein